MAKKKVQKKKSKTKKSSMSMVFMTAGLVMAIVFMATSVMLSVAMLPTFVAALVDRSKRKTKAVTVGAMNLAGSTPFILELWMEGNSLAKALSIITDPKAIIVMYSAAAVGYLIDWAMTGIVASILTQRGHARKKAIKKRQKELKERWGKEVTGEIPLDEQGFALDQPEPDVVD